MDPNLYLRFAIPGWTLFIAAASMIWASGDPWLTNTLGGFYKESECANGVVVAVAVALLGAPTIGFLLNTLVVSVSDRLPNREHPRWGKGPVHTKAMRDFQKRVSRAVKNDKGIDRKLRKAIKDASPASVVAHFEYRTDPELLLEWRRRQRAFFFLNWANVLAAALGAGLTAKMWGSEVLCQNNKWPLLPLAVIVVLAVCFVWNARASVRRVDDQQEIWAASINDDQIRDFIRHKGCGTDDQKPASDR